MKFTEDDIDFLSITTTQFEELCFELLIEMRYQNLIWRQGGADNGRDIEGYFQSSTPLVKTIDEKWFFECKRYKKGVPPGQLYSKVAWADAEKPRHLVFFISSYLSNSARTWLEKISSEKFYFVHKIEGKALKKLILKYPNIVTKYFINKYEKLLLESRKNWLIHGIYPDIATLFVLSEHLDFAKLTESEIGFFWCVAMLKANELDGYNVLNHDSHRKEMDGLFYHIASLNNTTSSLISDEQDLSTVEFGMSENIWGIADSQSVIANLLLDQSSKPKPALYSFVYDSKGKGIEVLIVATGDFPIKIRHIKENASTEAGKAEDYLFSKLK